MRQATPDSLGNIVIAIYILSNTGKYFIPGHLGQLYVRKRSKNIGFAGDIGGEIVPGENWKLLLDRLPSINGIS